ncbi:phage baseplate assembly protein W [Rahnella sp. BIGb0603]|jgi:phage baseplate assembly protein W|uniref:GPW/gp25 family protein n=1 Tax=Rahnella TaxID=34037 RepID=UPI00216AAAD6|nr:MULTISPECIES: GPW/gp25 family protein [Rahnella]MCS3425874.1 phage baseplate assembly protein W [Rahnella sp. BIGb0603]MDF1895723.1 GPW/gp25 family protein [Rahnella contaminans]
MSNPKYLGMNKNSGTAIEDFDHIRQSVSDILNTPAGSRVMRRNYGSLLSSLIDQPQNDALRLQMMAICYTALLHWEPRISLSAITFDTSYTGKMVVELTGNRSDTATDFSLNIPVS